MEHRLKVWVCVAERGSEALFLGQARVVQLKAESALLTAGTDYVKEKRDILASCIPKLEAAAETRHEEFGNVV